MVKHSNKPYLLSVVIPISKMAGRLQNFQKTYSTICKENEIQIILIHDLQDSETGVELARIMGPRPNPNVVFLEEFIGSPGGARNLGLKYVQGTWLNFVDSDDLYYPIRLMNVLREDSTADYSAVISNYETLDSATNLISPQTHNESLTKIAIRPGIWRWTFRADSVKEMKFTPLSMGEDQKFLYQFCQEKRKILFNNDCTYRYAINQDFQLTNQKIPKRDLINALSEILEIRRTTQTNFDEFTEAMIIKLCLSSIIHTNWGRKVKQLFIFCLVIFPISPVRVRYTRLILRNWK